MSTEQINDGGPAFPVADTHYPNGQIQYGCNGMSLRDWFAGQALAGLCARDLKIGGMGVEHIDSAYVVGAQLRGVEAYRQADSALKAREVKPRASEMALPGVVSG